MDSLLGWKKERLFRFVIDPDVEPTNSRAGRTLRPSVMYRKHNGGTRSDFVTGYIRKSSIMAEGSLEINKWMAGKRLKKMGGEAERIGENYRSNFVTLTCYIMSANLYTASNYKFSMNSYLKFVLLAIPYFFMVFGIGIYDRVDPRLGGWPFFYWFQLVWIFIAAFLTITVYSIERKEKKEKGGVSQ